MRIGFIGAHRTGKTTLANLLAEELEIPMVASNASSIASNKKFDMGAKNSIGRRLEFQEAILVDMLNNQVKAEGSFISDRTPIDAAAYLMADVQASVGTTQQHGELLEYFDAAARMTSKTYDVCIVVPPGIAVEPTKGKPPVNGAYQEHVHMLCGGMLVDDQVDLYWDAIPRDCLEVEDRMDAVRGILEAFEAE